MFAPLTMILINLLPSEFKAQTQKKPALTLDSKAAKIGGAFLVALTLFFYVKYLMGVGEVKKLRGQWTAIQQEALHADQISVELESGVKSERLFLDQYVVSPFLVTTALNAVSRSLPASIWLVELKMSREARGSSLLVKGVSLPSREKSSVEEVEKYLRDLKAALPANTELVLTTSRQQKEKRELTLFSAIFNWS